VLGDGAIIASNTSSIPIARLGAATSRPEHVLGLHFFNPVPVLPLLELVVSMRTDPGVADRAATFGSEQFGKSVNRSKDRSGFIVNAFLVPYLLSAVGMLESGFAAAEDIDTAGLEKGCAHPMGPLRLCDLIGPDTMKLGANSLYEEFKEPLYAAPLLLRMVESGCLGRKTGRGF
jgi:3-hydroxybutyryl-CoA dehydrogenase